MKRSIWWATPASASRWFSAAERADSRRYHGPLRRAAVIRFVARVSILGALLPIVRSVSGSAEQPETVGHALSMLWIPALTALAWWLPGAATEAWFQFVHEPRFDRGRPVATRFAVVTLLTLGGSLILSCAAGLVLWASIEPADPTSWWGVAAVILLIAGFLAVLDGSGAGPLAREGTALADGETASIAPMIARLGLDHVSIRLLDDQSTPDDGGLNACSAGAFGRPRLGVTAGLLAESPALVEFVVTHEVGHLRLGHHRRSFATAVVGALLVVGSLAGVVAALDSLGLQLLAAGNWPLLWMIAVTLGGLTGVARAFVGRADERAADRLAIEQLAQLPPLDMVRRLHVSATANLEPGRLERLLAHHPTPAERLEWLCGPT